MSNFFIHRREGTNITNIWIATYKIIDAYLEILEKCFYLIQLKDIIHIFS